MSRHKKHRRKTGNKIEPVRPLPPPPARVLEDPAPYCERFIIGCDFAAPGSRDFTSAAIVFPGNSMARIEGEPHEETAPPSQHGTRGCNVVAATAVLAFAAVFIGIILWILSFTP